MTDANSLDDAEPLPVEVSEAHIKWLESGCIGCDPAKWFMAGVEEERSLAPSRAPGSVGITDEEIEALGIVVRNADEPVTIRTRAHSALRKLNARAGSDEELALLVSTVLLTDAEREQARVSGVQFIDKSGCSLVPRWWVERRPETRDRILHALGLTPAAPIPQGEASELRVQSLGGVLHGWRGTHYTPLTEAEIADHALREAQKNTRELRADAVRGEDAGSVMQFRMGDASEAGKCDCVCPGTPNGHPDCVLCHGSGARPSLATPADIEKQRENWAAGELAIERLSKTKPDASEVEGKPNCWSCGACLAPYEKTCFRCNAVQVNGKIVEEQAAKLEAAESRYTEAVRQWGEDQERLAAWEPVVRAVFADYPGNSPAECHELQRYAVSDASDRVPEALRPEPLRPAGEKA